MAHINTILRLNAASCIGFGGLFLAQPGTVANFLASPPAPTAAPPTCTERAVRAIPGAAMSSALTRQPPRGRP